MSILGNNKVNTSQFVRNNGFDKPWNKYQVSIWIMVFILSLLCFGVEIIALHPNAWAPAYTCIGIVFVILIVLIVILTGIDPSDDNSLYHRKMRNKPMPVFDRSKHKHVIEGGYCHLCECVVLESSKHCQPCNKCVKGFDHHCMWLNNCVGSKNYKLFLGLLVATLLGSLGQLVIGVIVFVYGFLPDGDLLYQDVWWKQLPGGFVTFQVLIAIKALIVIIVIGLVVQLGVFHMMLIYRKQTTYSHFKMQEEKKLQAKLGKLRPDPLSPQRSINFDDMPVPACSEPHSDENILEDNAVHSIEKETSSFSNINHSYADEIA